MENIIKYRHFLGVVNADCPIFEEFRINFDLKENRLFENRLILKIVNHIKYLKCFS